MKISDQQIDEFIEELHIMHHKIILDDALERKFCVSSFSDEDGQELIRRIEERAFIIELETNRRITNAVSKIGIYLMVTAILAYLLTILLR